MLLPIIVNENGDLSFFASIKGAENYLEPIDVRNGEYVGYDSEGRLLSFSTNIESRPGLLGIGSRNVEAVKITEAESEPKHQEELLDALKRFLSGRVIPDTLAEKSSLTELLETAISKSGYSD